MSKISKSNLPLSRTIDLYPTQVTSFSANGNNLPTFVLDTISASGGLEGTVIATVANGTYAISMTVDGEEFSCGDAEFSNGSGDFVCNTGMDISGEAMVSVGISDIGYSASESVAVTPSISGVSPSEGRCFAIIINLMKAEIWPA
jgi:hypothetical protein